MSLARQQMRRGTSGQWTSANPVLASGERGWETDTNLVKIGDGGTVWTLLDYFSDITDLEDLVDAAQATLLATQTTVNAFGVWQSYTPTWAVLPPTGSPVYRYTRIGDMVTVNFRMSFTGAGAGTPSMTIPIPSKALTNSEGVGQAQLDLAGTRYGWAMVLSYVDQKINFLSEYTTPSVATYGALGAGNLSGQFTYEAA